MLKKLIFGITILLIISCQGNYQWENISYPSSQNQKTISHIRNCSVLIQTENKLLGSGVVVKNKGVVYIWTAAHVINPGWMTEPESKKTGENEKEKKDIVKKGAIGDKVKIMRFFFKENTNKLDLFLAYGEVIALGEKAKNDPDLALIKVTVGADKFSDYSIFFAGEDSRLNIGTEIFHVSNFKFDRFPVGSVMPGIIANKNYGSYGHQLDLASMNVYYGSSGGGLFLAENGQCVGIVVQILDSHFSPALFTPLREIRAFSVYNHILFAMPTK